jgi:hypothetical protein
MACLIWLVNLHPTFAQVKEKNNFEDWSKKPAVVTPLIENSAPSDAIILFNTNDLNQWESLLKKGTAAPWKISGNYFTVEPGTGDIITKQSFGDCQLQRRDRGVYTIFIPFRRIIAMNFLRRCVTIRSKDWFITRP